MKNATLKQIGDYLRENGYEGRVFIMGDRPGPPIQPPLYVYYEPPNSNDCVKLCSVVGITWAIHQESLYTIDAEEIPEPWFHGGRKP